MICSVHVRAADKLGSVRGCLDRGLEFGKPVDGSLVEQV